MDHFFEEAEGHMPLQAPPTDPAVVKELEAFTERYGLRFAEFPQGSWSPRVRPRRD
jgi:hypothetical protein